MVNQPFLLAAYVVPSGPPSVHIPYTDPVADLYRTIGGSMFLKNCLTIYELTDYW
jgi:hypothetical protein